MKKFFGEFKKFITRGNVVDMAVGVIVGGAFTAIVNGLSNFVLKPLINYLLFLISGGKGNPLEAIYTFLHTVPQVDETGAEIAGTIDLTKSIYIDWGSFINAIINFFLIALVLFIIVRTINSIRTKHDEVAAGIRTAKPTKEEKAEMKAAGINYKDNDAVMAFRDAKAQKQAEEEAEAARIAEEEAAKERALNPTTEDLLKDIIKILEAK